MDFVYRFLIFSKLVSKKAMLNWKNNLLTCLFVVFAAIVGNAQSSTWGGYAFQNSNGISDSYPMIFDISEKGNEIEGKSFFMVPDNPKLFVYYSFKGKKEGSTLYLTEYKIDKGANFDGTWLLKKMKIDFLDENTLQGVWEDVNGSGISGTITLGRVELIDSE